MNDDFVRVDKKTISDISNIKRNFYNRIVILSKISFLQELSFHTLKRMLLVVDEIIQKYPNPDEIRILDVGCGRGHIGVLLSDMGYNVFCIDSDERELDRFEKIKNNKKIKFSCTDAKEFLRNTHEKFDVVLMMEFLEHVNNPGDFINLSNVILKNNGLLIITTPNGLSVSEVFLMPLYRFINEKVLKIKKNPGWYHVNRFTINSFKKFFRINNFRFRKYRKTFTFPMFHGLATTSKKRISLYDLMIADYFPKELSGGWMVVGQKQAVK